jgi:hypothetical protein
MRKCTGSAVFAVLLFVTPAAWPQLLPHWLSLGAKAGAPTASPTTLSGVGGSDASQWIQFGPSVELKLPAGFAFEVDALYQRVGYNQSFIGSRPDLNTTTMTTYNVRGNDWQFPLLGKYYFRPSRGVQPYLAGGAVFGNTGSTLSGNSATIASGANLITVSPFQGLDSHRTNTGATAAAGARFKWGRIGLLPEVRYTHWGNAYLRQKNVVTLLMGFQF